LPEKLKEITQQKINEIDNFMSENFPHPDEPSEEEIDAWIKGYADYLEELSPEERAEELLRNLFSNIKESLQSEIKNKLVEIEE
jgi:hypothetical protein